MKKAFMFLPLNKKIFDIIFDVKSKDISPILEYYSVEKQILYDMLWEEYNIPGMEVRIANTAFDFLIECCEEKRDLCKTLKGEIKKNILASGIFYTNIAPEAATTADFRK